MALPKIDVPVFTTTLPSTGKQVKYRPFLVKEEKMLMIALQDNNETTIADAIKNIITNCTFGSIDVENLKSFDIEWLFLQLHIKSKGTTKDLKFKCTNKIKNEDGQEVQCDNENIVIFNLETAKAIKNEKHTNKIMITDDLGIIMKYPTFNDLNTLYKLLESEDIEKIYEAFGTYMESAFQGDTIFDSFTKDEIKEFIESLTNEQFNKIQSFFETMPKISATIPVKCRKCGHHEDVVIEGLQSFLE